MTDALIHLAINPGNRAKFKKARFPALQTYDPVEGLRVQATRALANQAGSYVTETLLKLLRDPAESIRVEAARALAGRVEPGVTDALLVLLGDPKYKMREVAAVSLSSRNAVQALADLISDSRRVGDLPAELTLLLANQLMDRQYSQIDPSRQASLLVAMTRLTELTWKATDNVKPVSWWPKSPLRMSSSSACRGNPVHAQNG